MEKRCFKCRKNKPIDQFYRHKEMADGHLNKCKDCTKKDANRWYHDPKVRERIRSYERARSKLPERKAMVVVYQKARRARNHGKELARSRVRNAIRTGIIKRLPCEVCGDAKSQAHHLDYRRQFNIKWLCFKHHRELHGHEIGELTNEQT